MKRQYKIEGIINVPDNVPGDEIVAANLCVMMYGEVCRDPFTVEKVEQKIHGKTKAEYIKLLKESEDNATDYKTYSKEWGTFNSIGIVYESILDEFDDEREEEKVIRDPKEYSIDRANQSCS